MPVRKTESRIPANFQASDLGEAVVDADGRCALVSFVTSPIVVDRQNTYVLFVTDPNLAEMAHTFEWVFTESEGTTEKQITQYSEISYQPQVVGLLNITVRILDHGNTEVHQLTLNQGVLPLNKELEIIILSEQDQAGPTIGNLEVVRELINDHNPYYQSVKLQTPENGDAFHRFIFGLIRNSALQRSQVQREQHIEKLANSHNEEAYDYSALIAQGVGVSGIRLPLLAMSLSEIPGSYNTVLNWTELPEKPDAKRLVSWTKLVQDYTELNEPKRIDLFNLARFPKSNITQCGRIVESLRNRYFAGTNFNDVMTGMSGTRAQWIIKHFRLGPLQRG